MGSVDIKAIQEIPRRRPIERPIGFEGFWLKWGKTIVTVINFSLFLVVTRADPVPFFWRFFRPGKKNFSAVSPVKL